MWNDTRVNFKEFLMVKNGSVWGLIDKENVSIQKHKILWTHNDTKEKNYSSLLVMQEVAWAVTLKTDKGK